MASRRRHAITPLAMLHIKDLTFRYGGRVLFEQATVAVPRGHRVALVGRNGTGKSTLLRLIAGELAHDGGSIRLPAGLKVGLLAQEAPGGEASLLETVLAADHERTALLAEAETATDPHRIADIHTRLADIGSHTGPARAGQILSGLGFDAATQARPCSAFSGGWRMRVALAGILFAAPDLLLLDEPTNHLDLEATLWLENYLRNYPHTVILVSHDRGLLNSLPTTTIHLDQGRLTAYAGGYDQFERTRRANLERLATLQTRQLAQRRRMEAFVERFRYKATKARQAQSRLKALERMEPIVSVIEEQTPVFDFPSPNPLPPPLMTLEEVSVGYAEGRPVLRRLNLRLDGDDRIALLGANGNGKSTLVKLLAGRLAPMSGSLRKPGKLKVGYFAQHQLEELAPELTTLAQGRRAMPTLTDEKIRAQLARFGLNQERMDTRTADLSGGEKARLLLALATREAPHVLLLDEPSNHLDVDSREALIQALNAYEGAVILISHDPHLISLTADRLWLVREGACQPFEGDLDDYRRLLLEIARDEARGESGSGRSAGGGDAAGRRRDQRRAAAEQRAVLAPLRKTIRDLESRMARLNAQRQALENQMADPDFYRQPASEVTRTQITLADLGKQIDAAEEAWFAAHETLEATTRDGDGDGAAEESGG